MSRSRVGGLVLAVGLALAGAGRAADLFADLISGKVVPLTITLKELTPEWRRLSVGNSAGRGGGAGAYAALLGGGTAQAYYTKGQTVGWSDQVFVVAYGVPSQALDFAAIMQMQRGGKAPASEPLTPDTVCNLALLHLQTLGNLTDIRPFDLARELADSAQAQESRKAVVESMGGARPRAVNSASMTNLKQIGMGLLMYAQDHGKFLPALTDAATAQAAIKGYFESDVVFAHPQTKEPYRPNTALSGKSLSGLEASKTVLFYEASPGEDGGRAVLFADGHVEQVNAARWTELQKAAGIP